MNGLLVTLIFVWGALFIWQSFTVQQKSITARHPKSRTLSINWPDIVDDVHSAIRAGMSLPQALAMLGESGQVQIRKEFRTAALSYDQTGDFKKALQTLAQELNDPTCDKFVSALVVAYDLGGSDLGRLLSTLSESLRSDTAIRGEIQARQSWTINGARLALAAPWLTVLVLSSRSDARDVYLSIQGVRLLIACGLISTLAYFVMQQVGRLPREPRLLGVPS